MLELLTQALYYLYALAGSVSLGYVLVRLVYPDIRTLDLRGKWKACIAAGAGLMALSLAVDFVFLQGFAAAIAFTLFVAALVLLNFFASLTRPAFLLVGLPTPAFLSDKEKLDKMRGIKAKVMAPVPGVKRLPSPPPRPEELTVPSREPTKKEAVEKEAVQPIVKHRRYAAVEGKPFFAGALEGIKNVFSRKPAAGVPPSERRAPAPPKPLVLTEEEAAEAFAEELIKEPAEPTAREAKPAEGSRRHRIYEKGKEAGGAEEEFSWVEEGKPGEAERTGRRHGRRREAAKGESEEEGERKELKAFAQSLQTAYSRQQGGRPDKKKPDKQGKHEIDSMLHDVSLQMKEGKTAGLAKDLGVKAPPPKEKGLSMADLFGEPGAEAAAGAGEAAAAPTLKTPAEKEGASLFDQLSAISVGKPAAGEEEKAKAHDVAFVKVDAEKGMGCPHCHSKNSRIVFCPYCGTGTCTNCTPSITPLPDAFVYQCPKCGEEFNVKKKAAAA